MEMVVATIIMEMTDIMRMGRKMIYFAMLMAIVLVLVIVLVSE